jgi:uncharacterized integral membrane protein
MPWRLILFLIVLALVVAFAGFNIQNTATISFGFYTLESVPIFLSLFASFFLGVLVMLPFTLGRRRRNRKKGGGEAKDAKKDSKKSAETPKLTEETRNAVGAGTGEEHAKAGKKARRKRVGKKNAGPSHVGSDSAAAGP